MNRGSGLYVRIGSRVVLGVALIVAAPPARFPILFAVLGWIGTTEASGRRDQAGLAARKRRVGAVRGAVPAKNEPKSDRPRAKTPMNRRKSRLRRRAAPRSDRVAAERGRLDGGNRRAPLHGGAATERGERPALGRPVALDGTAGRGDALIVKEPSDGSSAPSPRRSGPSRRSSGPGKATGATRSARRPGQLVVGGSQAARRTRRTLVPAVDVRSSTMHRSAPPGLTPRTHAPPDVRCRVAAPLSSCRS